MKIIFLKGNKSCAKRYLKLFISLDFLKAFKTKATQVLNQSIFISLDFLKAFKKRRSVRNSGQVTVEYILLAVTLLVLFQVVSKVFKENDSLKHFQETPQNIFKNMVENGNWIIDGDESRVKHPNHREFHFSSKGDTP